MKARKHAQTILYISNLSVSEEKIYIFFLIIKSLCHTCTFIVVTQRKNIIFNTYMTGLCIICDWDYFVGNIIKVLLKMWWSGQKKNENNKRKTCESEFIISESNPFVFCHNSVSWNLLISPPMDFGYSFLVFFRFFNIQYTYL